MPVAELAIDTKPPQRFGLSWLDCGRRHTSRGPRHLYEAAPTEAFSAAWKADKARLRDTGFGLSPPRAGGDWTVCFWARPNAAAVQEAAVATAAAVEASRATDAAMEIPAPEGMAYLPYQRGGIAYCMARLAALIGDEMGLGKTIQAIGVANASGAKAILVLCPASLKLNWRRELARWLVADLPVHVVEGGKAAFPDVTGGGVVIVNYDVLHAYTADVRSTTWDLLIGDEAHFLKEKDTRRTRAAFGGAKTKTSEAITPIPARRRLLLTGTPMNSRPKELFPLLHYLDPVAWPEFWPFARRYCAAHRDRNGFWDLDGASHQAELQEKLRSTVMVRRLKAEVLIELPPKVRQVLPLPADTAALRRLLRDEQAAHDAWERLRDAKEAGADAAFDQLSRLREQVGLAKAPLIAEHVATDAGPVVAFAHHKSVVHHTAAALRKAGRRVVVVMGDMDVAERQASVDAFQASEADVIIGTLGAMGVGLTLTRSSHVVIGELDWVPSTISQAEDRCHRIGQTGSVHVEHLVFEGSLDSRLVEVLIDKQRVLDAVLDDRPATAPVSAEADSAAPSTAPSLADVAPVLDDDAIAEIEATAAAAVEAKREAAQARRREREEREEAQRAEDAMEVPEILAALATALATQGWSISKENWERARVLASCTDLTGSECNEAFSLIARMAANAAKAADRLKGEVVESAYADRAVDPEVRKVALEACRWLAARDADHALEENGIGYGKDTSSTGHALAAQDGLDEHAAAVALDVLWTHRRQLAQDTLDRLFGEVAAGEGRPTPTPAPVEAPVEAPLAAPEPEEAAEPPVPAEPAPEAEPVAAVEPAPAATPTPAQERLRRAGELVYGPRWQTDLARDLDLADRTVRRYAAGVVPIPDDLWPRIDGVIRARRDAMSAFLGEPASVTPAPEPVRRRADLPEPGVSTEDYLFGCVVALHADRGRREQSQYQVIPADDLAYLREHHEEIVVEPCGPSGLLMAMASPEAPLDVINRVADIVSASVDATVAAGRKPAWVSAAQADAAIERALPDGT